MLGRVLAKLAVWILSLMYMGPKAGGRDDRRDCDRDRLQGPRRIESAMQPAGYVLDQTLQFF
jgi:hypothetical protein